MPRLEKTSKAKGDALETAVRAIESTVLAFEPGLSQDTFEINGPVRRVIDGARYEADVLVRVVLGAGYGSAFMFECKNWEKRAGRALIGEFSEKIEVFQAQRGFFVAKSYTKDAIARARRDPRIELLYAEELGPMTPLQSLVRAFEFGDEVHGDVAAFTEGDRALDADWPPEAQRHALVIDERAVNPTEYYRLWLSEVCSNPEPYLPPDGAADGEHLLRFDVERRFEPGAATLNGEPLLKLKLTVSMHVHLVRGIIVSGFDVATRGRFVTVEARLPKYVWSLDLTEVSPPQGTKQGRTKGGSQ